MDVGIPMLQTEFEVKAAQHTSSAGNGMSVGLGERELSYTSVLLICLTQKPSNSM